MITVSNDVLVNPKLISSIETRRVNKRVAYFVVAGDKTYEIKVPIDKFLEEVNRTHDEGKQHHFAG